MPRRRRQALGFLQPPGELRAPRLLRAQHESQPRLTEAVGQRAQCLEAAVGAGDVAGLHDGHAAPDERPELLLRIVAGLGELHQLGGRVEALGQRLRPPHRGDAEREHVRQGRDVVVATSELDGLVAQRAPAPVVARPEQLGGQEGPQARAAWIRRAACSSAASSTATRSTSTKPAELKYPRLLARAARTSWSPSPAASAARATSSRVSRNWGTPACS